MQHAQQVAPPGPGHQQHDEQHRQEDRRRSQVGLFQHQQHGQRRQGQRNQQSAQPAVVLAIHQVSAQDEHEGQLGELGRLQADMSPTHPAMCPVDGPKEIDDHQQQNRQTRRSRNSSGKAAGSWAASLPAWPPSQGRPRAFVAEDSAARRRQNPRTAPARAAQVPSALRRPGESTRECDAPKRRLSRG